MCCIDRLKSQSLSGASARISWPSKSDRLLSPEAVIQTTKKLNRRRAQSGQLRPSNRTENRSNTNIRTTARSIRGRCHYLFCVLRKSSSAVPSHASVSSVWCQVVVWNESPCNDSYSICILIKLRYLLNSLWSTMASSKR